MVCVWTFLVIIFTKSAQAFEFPTGMQGEVYKISYAYGVDPELALAIISCESRSGQNKLHLNDNGTKDYGLFQINQVHEQEAKKMGIDIHTDKGNIVYGVWLMKQNGIKDWNASKSCWSKKIAV